MHVQLSFQGGPWANQLLDSAVHTAPEFVAPSPDQPGIYRRTNQERGAAAVVYEWLPEHSPQSREVPLIEDIVRHEARIGRRAPHRPPRGRADDERGMRVRFGLEVAGAVGALVLALVTVVWRDWIEVVFRVNPDQGSGALEWLVVFAFAAISIGLSLAARRHWRRLKLAT